MALIIPDGFAQITVPFTHDGLARQAVITFGAEYSGVETPADECQFHLAALTDNVTFDSNVLVGPVRGRFGVPVGEPLAAEGTGTFSGTSSAERVPSNTALLVSKRSGRGGRRGRGRMYFPWHVEEAEVDELGFIDGGLHTSIQGEFDDWFTELTVTDRSMVILHDSEGATAPGSPDTVLGLIVSTQVATQRRRLRS